MFPKQYVEILRSDLEENFFRFNQAGAYCQLKEIKTGVPQRSVSDPVLYLLYISNIPQQPRSKIATIVGNTAISAVVKFYLEVKTKLQEFCNPMEEWKIGINEVKSVHVDFT